MIDHEGKLCFIHTYLEGLMYFKKETVDDHAKRNVFRYFFILVDTYLKYIGAYKNLIYRQQLINLEKRNKIEQLIRQLKNDYDNIYDTIRDKLGAHQQPLSLVEVADWWLEIDSTTVTVLYDELQEIKSLLEESLGGPLGKIISDYSPLDFNDTPLAVRGTGAARVAPDRLGPAKEGAAFLVSCHETQAKTQIITSIIDLIKINWIIIGATSAQDTLYKKVLFDIAWFLVIADCCSLIDNLYIDNQYDASLLSLWGRHDFKGYPFLIEGDKKREVGLESKIRDVRNKLIAHLDSDTTMKNILKLYFDLDLKDVYSFLEYHVNAFWDGCMADIRAKVLTIPETNLRGVLPPSADHYKPFDR